MQRSGRACSRAVPRPVSDRVRAGGFRAASAEVDRFAPIHGLYWLLANLCDQQPVLLVDDDAQWADTQSLRWLDYLARRAPDTAVLIVVGARTGEADEPAELEPLRNARARSCGPRR